MAAQDNAIELKNITKRFGSVVANDKVCLTVKKGEILSILGENGSGKTTLMNMLSGIYFPDEGEIYVDGKEVTIASPKDSFALGIGMIHQHFKLVDVLTAAENIILGLPGETHDTMVAQAEILSDLPLATLKIHQLQLIRGTRMAHEYDEAPDGFHLFNEVEEYIDLVIDYVEHLRPDIVVERFVSQSPKDLLIAPDWGLKNYEFVARLQKRMKERGAYQGKKYRDSEKRIIFADDKLTTE